MAAVTGDIQELKVSPYARKLHDRIARSSFNKVTNAKWSLPSQKDVRKEWDAARAADDSPPQRLSKSKTLAKRKSTTSLTAAAPSASQHAEDEDEEEQDGGDQDSNDGEDEAGDEDDADNEDIPRPQKRSRAVHGNTPASAIELPDSEPVFPPPPVKKTRQQTTLVSFSGPPTTISSATVLRRNVAPLALPAPPRTKTACSLSWLGGVMRARPSP